MYIFSIEISSEMKGSYFSYQMPLSKEFSISGVNEDPCIETNGAPLFATVTAISKA